jgi:hypothetical protein
MGAIDVPRVPRIDSAWWRIGDNPDLGELTSERQEIVGHAIFRSADGQWHCWACVRFTKAGRLFYHWQGESIEQPDWTPMGIAMQSDPTYGESAGNAPDAAVLQAPHVLREGNTFYMFYGGGGSPYVQRPRGTINLHQQICLATSPDGHSFLRHRGADGYSQIFHDRGARDPMVIKVGHQFLCYYCANQDVGAFGGTTPGNKNLVAVRTSFDLHSWSAPKVVCTGGSPGSGGSSAECPFVVFLDGYFYLFRSSSYDPPVSHVYRSKDPMDFGLDSDAQRVAVLPAAAPEVIQDGDRFFISSVHDLRGGIQVARLAWEEV